jgi:hypothetical protein
MSGALTPEIIPASTNQFAIIIGETIGGEISSDNVIAAVEQICLDANEVSLKNGGFESVEAARKKLKKLRVAIDKHRKDLGAELREQLNQINSAGNYLLELLQPAEQRLIGLSEQHKAEQARLKQEAEQRERDRLNALNAERIESLMDVDSALTDGRWFAEMSSEEWESEKSRILNKDAEIKEQQRAAAEAAAAAQAEIDRLKAEQAAREEAERQAAAEAAAKREEINLQRWETIRESGVENEWVGDPVDFTEQSFNQILERLITERREREERERRRQGQIDLANQLIQSAVDANPELHEVYPDAFAAIITSAHSGAFANANAVRDAADSRTAELKEMLAAKKAAQEAEAARLQAQQEAREAAERELAERQAAEERMKAERRQRLIDDCIHKAESLKEVLVTRFNTVDWIEGFGSANYIKHTETLFAEAFQDPKILAVLFLASDTYSSNDLLQKFEQDVRGWIEDHVDAAIKQQQELRDAEIIAKDRDRISAIMSPAIESLQAVQAVQFHPAVNAAQLLDELRELMAKYQIEL